MEESQVPPPEPSPTFKSPPAHPRKHLLRAAIPFVAVIAVIIVGLILAKPISHSSGPKGSVHLIIDNKTKNSLVIADPSGKQTSTVSYPSGSYINFDSSYKNEALMSYAMSPGNYGFLLVKDNQKASLNSTAEKTLNLATVVNGSHQIAFTDSDNVAFVSCPSGKTCQLMSLNLPSGNSKTLVDTGAKPIIPTLPAAYVLGASTDGKTIYVRTLATNKLGKTVSGVYALDDNGKVKNSWSLPRDADFAAALSPDAQMVAYKTGFKPDLKVGVLNLATRKTYTTKWTGGAIVDQPTSFSWSPDSKKVLFWGSDSILPRAANATFSIKLAYLDASNNQITNLQTIQDAAHNQISYLAWTDNSNAVYNQQTSTQAYNFTSVTSQVYKLNANSKAVAKYDNISGQLIEVANW